MSDAPPSGFWTHAVALIASCAVGGGIVGLVGGLVVGDVSRGVAVGIAAGSVVAVALVPLDRRATRT